MTILKRNSSDHECCGYDQYNTKTQCCCVIDDKLEIHPINSNCCKGVQPQNVQDSQSNCTSLYYNPNDFRCCERNQTMSHWCCAPGRCDAAVTLYNPKTHVCCDGCLYERMPWRDQCCGETPYGLAQRGVLCCNNTLYKDGEDGEECSEINIAYNPAKGTTFCCQSHGLPGQHCCGTEVYEPSTEICCNGHRYPKKENMHCCGVKAYNIKDTQMKCCAGTLYNLTCLGHGHDAQCCGSILQKPMDVCCSCEDKEVVYTKKTGFRCCGHLYFNTSLWSCCAGKLSPVHQPGQHQSNMIEESRLLSMNNLNETHLCENILIGTLEHVSLRSIVFSSVLKICGRNAIMKPLPSPHILKRSDHCNSPKLIPGKTYFFDEANFFTDFNSGSIVQSLHFIISKCYCCQVTAG
ncbi:galaxin isoform X1 [Micropterus dolomieu]|uniref:galaxin isoform X1 n=1 Tax=Micropterus dolomieu TaxID=147949 RepID=UPI001E8CAB4F|nr:galaxin isoform X1 [Micropterus dolomieu]